MVDARWLGRSIAALVAASLLGGCASGGGSVATPDATMPIATAPAASGAGPSPSSGATGSASPAVGETHGITYGATGGLTRPEQLDVYAPTKSGQWPVVVLFHGQPGASKTNYRVQASELAAHGFVVFVPNWGNLASGGGAGVPTRSEFEAFAGEGACAIAFARSHAVEYGGDATTMIVFGHSAGANLAGVIAFTRPAPTPGCPGGPTLGAIHALVTWDGDWTMTDPSWDAILTDRASWTTMTPITHIASDKTLPVVLLGSGVVGEYVRDLGDPKALDAFFRLRDPSGALRKQLTATGVLDDKAYDIQEIQQVFSTLLKAQGNPVTLAVLPGAAHASLGSAMGTEALAVFVSAFETAAAP